MGASCSSSTDKRYRDAVNYLRLKPCTTYTYSRAFSPIVRDLPPVIIIGEQHLENPSIHLDPERRNCSTVTGIMNEIASTCDSPKSRLTVLIEDKIEDKEHNIERPISQVLLDVFNNENPFNVNRQKVILDYVSRKFPERAIEVLRSDIFFLARSIFIFNGHQDLDTLKTFTSSNLREWLEITGGVTYQGYQILAEEGKKLAKGHMVHFDDIMRNDDVINYLSEFSHTVFLYIQTNPSRITHSGVYDYVYNRFIELFLKIEENYVPQCSRKRKREEDKHDEEGEVNNHYMDAGLLLSFLGDVLNFHRIGSVTGTVLISYGQFHAENFTEMIEETKLYKKDHSFGDISII